MHSAVRSVHGENRYGWHSQKFLVVNNIAASPRYLCVMIIYIVDIIHWLCCISHINVVTRDLVITIRTSWSSFTMDRRVVSRICFLTSRRCRGGLRAHKRARVNSAWAFIVRMKSAFSSESNRSFPKGDTPSVFSYIFVFCTRAYVCAHFVLLPTNVLEDRHMSLW